MRESNESVSGRIGSSGIVAPPGTVIEEAVSTLGPRRVTQFYDSRLGTFGPASETARVTNPARGIEGLLERLVDAPRGPATWVAPRAAGEHTAWSRIMTGVGEYRNYVEFTVQPGEGVGPGGLKSLFSRYQQIVPGSVPLAGRDAVFGALRPNYEYWALAGGLDAVGAGLLYSEREKIKYLVAGDQ